MITKGTAKGIAVLALALAIALPSLAATTGTISLSGSVGGVCDVTVTQPTGNNSLAITTKVTNQTIATFVEKCNKASGYTLTLSSANNSVLKGSLAGNTDTLPYSLVYGTTIATATAVSLSAGSAVITDASAKTASTGVTKILAISFDGTSFLNEDSYSDTLTFTIAAK
jgi:hypothetical protein